MPGDFETSLLYIAQWDLLTGVIQPHAFEPDDDSQEEEKELPEHGHLKVDASECFIPAKLSPSPTSP